jgi:hypothetical protein
MDVRQSARRYRDQREGNPWPVAHQGLEGMAMVSEDSSDAKDRRLLGSARWHFETWARPEIKAFGSVGARHWLRRSRRRQVSPVNMQL